MSLDSQFLKSGRTLRALGWQGQLDQAATPEAVLAVARDFLAQVSPEEIAELPVDCRPGRLVDGDDIAIYAVTLARHAAEDDSHDLLHKLSTFFADANLRMSQVLAQAQSGRRKTT